MLKFVVFLALLSAAIAIDEEKKVKIAKAVKECQGDDATRVSVITIDKFFIGEDTDDPQVAKFLTCYSKKLGFLKNEKLDIETLKTFWNKGYNAEHITKLNECLVDKEDEIATIKHLYKCRREAVGFNKEVLEIIKNNSL